MIVILIAFGIVGTIVYFSLTLFCKEMRNSKRLLISLSVFIALSLLFTLAIIIIGDPLPPDAVEFTLDDIDKNTGGFKKNLNP
jgi:hypothetical protein